MKELLEKIKKNGSKKVPDCNANGCGSQNNCQRC